MPSFSTCNMITTELTCLDRNNVYAVIEITAFDKGNLKRKHIPFTLLGSIFLFFFFPAKPFHFCLDFPYHNTEPKGEGTGRFT